jgi:hypothetical protein
VNRYGQATALTLLAISLFLLHGLTSWTPVFQWFPVFTCVSLLASVNIAPTAMEILTYLGIGFFALIEMGRSPRTQAEQDRDLEQTLGLLPGMAEYPNAGHRGHEDIGFLLNHMDRPREAEDSQDSEEENSIDLDARSVSAQSVSTRPDVRTWMQYFGPVRDPVPQHTALLAYNGTLPEQNESFPRPPQEEPQQYMPERPSSGNSQGSSTDVSSMVPMMPG